MSNDAGMQYMVRDTAGNVYGPATVGLLRQWAMEGRVTGQMLVAPQGTEGYVAACQMAELAGAFLPAAGMGGPGYGGQAYGGQQYGAMPGALNQSMAITSLVCGIASLMVCGIFGILAVVFGHIARGQIRREPERYGGAGMALAGLIIGYAGLALTVVVVIVFIVLAATDSLH